MLSLISLGLTPAQAYHLLTDETVGASQTDSDPTVGLVDSSDRIEGGNVILWWNDIEKDSR
jgi:UDP-glucose:glycoprotein glucosyltransferase